VKSVALQMRNKRNKRITARRFVHARSDSNVGVAFSPFQRSAYSVT
jgi:hypothetical protein